MRLKNAVRREKFARGRNWNASLKLKSEARANGSASSLQSFDPKAKVMPKSAYLPP